MEFSEGRQSGERINLGLSFASFGQAKEDEKYNSHYGFIFTKASHTEEQISRAIAHELGHVPIAIGTFHLWHTFSTENKYVASQGTTTNLMDYNGTATDLYKYQWDYIHNPEFVIFRGDDEEGETIVLSIFEDENEKEAYSNIIDELKSNIIFKTIYEDIENSEQIFKIIDYLVSDNSIEEMKDVISHPGRNGEFLVAEDNIDKWTFFGLFELFTIETKAGEEGNEHIIKLTSPQNANIVNKYLKNKKKKVFANGINYHTIFEEFFHAAHYLYLDSRNIYDKTSYFIQTETEVVYIRLFVYYYLSINNVVNDEYYAFDNLRLLESEIGNDIKNEFDNILKRKEVDHSIHNKILEKIINERSKNPSYKNLNVNDLDYSIPFSNYLIDKLKNK